MTQSDVKLCLEIVILLCYYVIMFVIKNQNHIKNRK